MAMVKYCIKRKGMSWQVRHDIPFLNNYYHQNLLPEQF